MAGTTTSHSTAPVPPRPRMDPRIRERRVAVKRDEGRRRLRVLLAVLGAVGAVALAYGVTRSPLLDVDRIEIQGSTATPADEVARAGGLHDRPQLADVEPLQAAAGIERLPWVFDATVVRHWPGTVEIRIVERAPLAAVPAAVGGWALVDRTGRVLELQTDPPPGLAVVDGAAAPAPGGRLPPAALAGLAVVDALPASLSQLLERVTVAEDDTLTLGLQGLPTVQFGPPDQVRPKLVALSTLVTRTKLQGVRAIDVRVPTAPVLTRT